MTIEKDIKALEAELARLNYRLITLAKDSGGAGTDEKVAVDAVATAGYLGSAFDDGVLRTSSPLSFSDGGDFITLGFSHLGFQSLADPGADRIAFWDNSEGAMKWLQLGGGVSIDATPQLEIDHDAIDNYDPNHHIDHTGVSISAGTGLTGGGDISANRTISLSHLGLEALADPGGDRIMFWDDGEGALKWLEGSEGIQIVTTNILLNINGLGEDAGAESGDFFVYYDTVDGIHYKIDFDDMPAGVGGDSPWTEDVNDIYWDGTGHVTIGSTAPDTKMTVAGLTIYTPATADTLHFAIQNADVAHGFTSYADADTYLAIQKHSNTAGGAWIAGFSEATTSGIMLWGLSNVAPSGNNTTSVGCVNIGAGELSGTGGSALEDADNICVFQNWTVTALIIKGDGSIINPDIGGTSNWMLGDNANTKMTSGLTIQQRGNSNEALAIKSTFVVHGYTTDHESDTYYAIQKYHSTEGGASIVGMGEVTVGVEIKGGGDTDNTTKSSAGIAPIILNATKAVGGTFASVGADGNLVAMQNFGSSVWILDEDGDVWQNGVLHVPNMKTGIDQADAGASAGELYVDTDDDNTIKMGV